MAQAVAQTIYRDLRSQAHRLLTTGKPTDFEVRRLSGDLEKLAGVDAMGALEIKATLAAVRGDHEASVQLFDGLLAATGGEARFLRRATQVAAVTGQTLRLKALYDHYLAGLELPVDWKREIGQLLGFNGWYRESVRIQGELRAIGEDPGTKDTNWLSFAEPIAEDEGEELPGFASRTSATDVLDVNGVADEEVALLFSKSITLLRAWALPPAAARTINVVHEDSTSGIFVSFMVKGNVDDVAEAEWSLFGELAADAPPVLLNGVISIGVLACQGEARGS